MKKRIISLALSLVLILAVIVPAMAASYSLSIRPDKFQGAGNVQSMWYLVDSQDSSGNDMNGKIPNEVLQTMTKIEVTMPQRESEPDSPDGLVFILGGFGDWWCQTESIPWKNGKVTATAADFPKKPSDVYLIDEDNTGGYLVIVDGWWTNTWAELGVTNIAITYGSGSTASTGGAPAAGDSSMLALAIALFMLSGAAFFVIRRKVRA